MFLQRPLNIQSTVAASSSCRVVSTAVSDKGCQTIKNSMGSSAVGFSLGSSSSEVLTRIPGFGRPRFDRVGLGLVGDRRRSHVSFQHARAIESSLFQRFRLKFSCLQCPAGLMSVLHVISQPPPTPWKARARTWMGHSWCFKASVGEGAGFLATVSAALGQCDLDIRKTAVSPPPSVFNLVS